MRRCILAFAATTAVFLVLDAAWLTSMGPRLYRPALGHLMRPDVDWLAVALFYPVYIAGLLGFAVAPAANKRSAALRGALFALVAYATYDLTNQATLRGWPWMLTGLDLCWGALASAIAGAVGAAAWRRGAPLTSR